MDRSPFGFQTRCLGGGLFPYQQVLKVGVPDVGFKPFSTWRSAGFWVLSQLWITRPNVGLIERLCFSPTY